MIIKAEQEVMLSDDAYETNLEKKIARNEKAMNEKLDKIKAERNKPFDLEDKLSEAQAELKQAQSGMKGEDEKKKIPSKDTVSEKYAKIVAVYYLKLRSKDGLNKAGADVHDNKSFEYFVDSTIRPSKDFKKMIEMNTSEALFEHSLRDKGQGIFEDYSVAHRARKEEKNRKPEGNVTEPVKEQNKNKVLDGSK